jgi:hypothetical protein
VQRGDAPDLAIVAHPGQVVQFAQQRGGGGFIELSAYLDPAEARRQAGDYLVDIVSVGSSYFGVPILLNVKGLVWYSVPEFEQAGYAVPDTWDELVDLSRQMVADGRTPWCMGLGDFGGFSGWPATDWIEALVLRLGGVDLYDRWVDGEIPFDDPVIRQAAAMFGQVAFGDGFVRGGADSLSRISAVEAGDAMFLDPPGCWLHYQSTIVPLFLPPGAAPGTDVDYFVLPPVDPDGGTPVFGGTGFVSAFRDRPEVRESGCAGTGYGGPTARSRWTRLVTTEVSYPRAGSATWPWTPPPWRSWCVTARPWTSGQQRVVWSSCRTPLCSASCLTARVPCGSTISPDALDDMTATLPDVAIEVCERTIEVAGTDIADMRTSAAAAGPQVTSIVLRLYRQAEPALRSRCLDLIDRLTEVAVYGVSQALDGER